MRYLIALLLTALPSFAQIGGAGQVGCNGTVVTGTAANTSTSNNTVLLTINPVMAGTVSVQINGGANLTAGAITFLDTMDGTNFVALPVKRVLDPDTYGQLTNPYTLVSSTNQRFLLVMSGASQLQVKLTTAITTSSGAGTTTPFATQVCYNPPMGPHIGGGTAGSAETHPVTVQGIASMTKLLVTPDSVALPANQSVNAAQLAGTTTDTNSGNKSAGTLRVVLATDQPQLTNKLLVTPDANSAVNTAQINGVTPLMGNGTTGTGSQRVTIASDNTAFAVNSTLSAETTKVIGTARVLGNAGAAFDAATGAAPPANVVYVGGLKSGATGGLLGGITACDSDKSVNISTATTTLLVTGLHRRHRIYMRYRDGRYDRRHERCQRVQSWGEWRLRAWQWTRGNSDNRDDGRQRVSRDIRRHAIVGKHQIHDLLRRAHANP